MNKLLSERVQKIIKLIADAEGSLSLVQGSFMYFKHITWLSVEELLQLIIDQQDYIQELEVKNNTDFVESLNIDIIAKAIYNSNPELRYDNGVARNASWEEIQGGANYYRNLAKSALDLIRIQNHEQRISFLDRISNFNQQFDTWSNERKQSILKDVETTPKYEN